MTPQQTAEFLQRYMRAPDSLIAVIDRKKVYSRRYNWQPPSDSDLQTFIRLAKVEALFKGLQGQMEIYCERALGFEQPWELWTTVSVFPKKLQDRPWDE